MMQEIHHWSATFHVTRPGRVDAPKCRISDGARQLQDIDGRSRESMR